MPRISRTSLFTAAGASGGELAGNCASDRHPSARKVVPCPFLPDCTVSHQNPVQRSPLNPEMLVHAGKSAAQGRALPGGVGCRRLHASVFEALAELAIRRAPSTSYCGPEPDDSVRAL